MKKVLVLSLLMAFSPVSLAAQDHSAEAVASALLHGFAAQNLEMILPHLSNSTRPVFENIHGNAAATARIWQAPESQAAQIWDGNILPARYTTGQDGNAQAIIPFASETVRGPQALGAEGASRHYVMVLVLDGAADTSWGFGNINMVAPAIYDGLSATR